MRFAGDGSERKLMADYAPITQALTRSDMRPVDDLLLT